MKYTLKGLLCLFGVILFSVGFPLAINAQSGGMLYQFEKQQQLDLKESNVHYLTELQDDITYLDHRLFRFNVNDFNQMKYDNVLKLPLFDSAEDILTCVKIRTEERSERNYTWFGDAEGYGESNIILTVSGGFLAGRIHYNGEVFTIRSVGGDLYALIKVDPSSLPQDEPDKDYEEMKSKKATPSKNKMEDMDFFYRSKTSDGNNYTAEDSPEAGNCKIRLMIAYTDDIGSSYSGILATLQNEVDTYNQINANSTVDHRVEVAVIVETNYDEAANYSLVDKVADFSGTSDGNMDEIHNLRNLYDADMCGLVFKTGQGCGRADAIGATSSTAFQVSRYNCFYKYTLQHEMGHLLNARHDHFVDNGGLAYNHGYTHPATSGNNPFRTLMAYSNACTGTGITCPRVDHISDYQVNYNGDPTGVSNYAHNERIIDNNWDATIAAFQSYEVNKSIWLTDIIENQEEATVTGSTSITTEVAHPITYQSGSEGTYTAGTSITLKAGFRAAKGSHFRAYLDNCTNNFFAPGDDDVASANAAGDNGNLSFGDRLKLEGTNINVYPNPSSGEFTLAYTVLADESPVNISLYDVKGQVVEQILNQTNHHKGAFTIAYNGKKLSKGLYYCRMVTNDKVVVKSITITE
ncbi:MAG TPA: T9SS type A sorting domain-containing protein [Saprospiraceae bacterium]|nr:T9SS type A sorting domain-containing protein [Saprospiraceae bacterium]